MSCHRRVYNQLLADRVTCELPDELVLPPDFVPPGAGVEDGLVLLRKLGVVFNDCGGEGLRGRGHATVGEFGDGIGRTGLDHERAEGAGEERHVGGMFEYGLSMIGNRNLMIRVYIGVKHDASVR